MNLFGLYNIISNELKDCFFETCKHQIASDTVTRSNMEDRQIMFPTNSPVRECSLCKVPTQQSLFVSLPSLYQTLLLEWVYCTSIGCIKHVPQLKLTNRVYRPSMLTARMNENLFSVERIYTNYIESKWERIIDEASNAVIPLDVIHMICLYDPFHFSCVSG